MIYALFFINFFLTCFPSFDFFLAFAIGKIDTSFASSTFFTPTSAQARSG